MALLDHKNLEDIEFTPLGAVFGMVKSGISVVITSFILIESGVMFSRFKETEDGVLVSAARGMKSLLYVILAMAVIGLIHSIIEFFVIKNGSYEDGIGRIFLYFTGIIQANYANVYMIIFGLLFGGFAFFFLTAGGFFTNGDTAGLIIGIVFVLAGLGIVAGGVAGIVRMVKESISDFTLNVRQ